MKICAIRIPLRPQTWLRERRIYLGPFQMADCVTDSSLFLRSTHCRAQQTRPSGLRWLVDEAVSRAALQFYGINRADNCGSLCETCADFVCSSASASVWNQHFPSRWKRCARCMVIRGISIKMRSCCVPWVDVLSFRHTCSLHAALNLSSVCRADFNRFLHTVIWNLCTVCPHVALSLKSFVGN